MLLSTPLVSIFPGARAAVLAVLAGPDVAFTGRQVASLVTPAMSLKAVQTALNDLVVEGLVHRSVVGRAHQYTFNHEHLTASAIEGILGARASLFERIASTVSGWDSPPLAVWVFGSTARGDESATSDIDLMIIRGDHIDEDSDHWVDAVWSLTERVSVWTGLQCEALQFSSTEAREGWRTGAPVLQDAAEQGLTVWGPAPREWVRSLKE